VVCWDLRNRRQGSVFHSRDDPFGSIWGVSFTSDGSLMVFSTGQGLRVSPTPAGCPTSESVLRLGTGAFSRVLVPVGDTRLLVSTGQGLSVVDVRLGREVRAYRLEVAHAGSIGDIAVSSDARTFAVTVSNGDILWYEVETGAQVGVVHTSSGHSGAIAFAPRSRQVARATTTSIELWDPQGGLGGRLDGSAQQLRFSADGQLLFGLDNAEVLRIWDVPGRTLLGTLQVLPLVDNKGNQTADGSAHGLRTAMRLGPDGMLWFAAASAQPTGWAFSVPTWERRACAWAGRSLSGDEWLRYVGTTPPEDLSCVR
jgi:WD40 repeat protein